jgi:hypothetical protein
VLNIPLSIDGTIGLFDRHHNVVSSMDRLMENSEQEWLFTPGRLDFHNFDNAASQLRLGGIERAARSGNDQ